MLTADHVIADMRRGANRKRLADGGVLVIGPKEAGFVAVLGYGLIFGTIGLPPEAIAPVVRAWSPSLEGDDPLAQLRGEADLRLLDVSILQACLAAEDWVHCLPLRASPPQPQVGDTVVAFGFPNIMTFRGDNEAARTIIEEGMYAAYGQITRLLPEGRDRSNPTPVFEVEGNWPCGMSGGPVVNSYGEVIRVVSRSLLPEQGSSLGTGWATWLGAFVEFQDWVPTVDPNNPTWRRGWALIQEEPWRIEGVYATEAIANEKLQRSSTGAQVRKGVWRLGTDDFIS